MRKWHQEHPLLSMMMPKISQLLFCVAGLSTVVAKNTTSYIGMAGNAGTPTGETALQWCKFSYPTNPNKFSTVDSVTVSNSASTNVLGEFASLDPADVGGKVMLTCKTIDDSASDGALYCYINNGIYAGIVGGCCADEVRVYNKSTGGHSSFDLSSILEPISAAIGVTVYPSHTFDVSVIGATTYAIVNVIYANAALQNSAYSDMLVAVSMRDGSILKTADGNSYFDMFTELGTTSTATSDSIYKVQYIPASAFGRFHGESEQWHQNGCSRFSMADTTQVIAITHRSLNEAVVFMDPWAYTSSAGGGTILQRFGTPTIYDSSGESAGNHYFGLASSESIFNGMHNVRYKLYASGKETVSVFVNSQATTTDERVSHAYEFVLNTTSMNRVLNSQPLITDDSAFSTTYTSVTLAYFTGSQGGVKAIGKGVYIVASGGAKEGISVYDTSGGSKQCSYTDSSGSALEIAIYDPFITVNAG